MVDQTMDDVGVVARETRRPAPAKTKISPKLKRSVLMLGGVAIMAIGSALAWVSGGRIVSIDDAYVGAPKLLIATDISGIVSDIAVHEGQSVKAGDVLLRLDSTAFRIAVDGRKAEVDQAVLSVSAMEADYRRMLADIEAQQAQVDLNQAQYERYADLVKRDNVSRSNFDQARFQLASSRKTLDSLRQQARVQLAKLAGVADLAPEKHPQVLQAKAALAEAQRQLDHAVVKAPFAGIVTQVDSLQPGAYLAADTPAFALVGTERIWVDASPKETDLTWVKPGDKVEVHVDTYPDRVWQGTVETIAPASGAQFSVLPAQNASGNWVKVVQRIPLRIRLDADQAAPVLRAGMSVVADIDTGHRRAFTDLLPASLRPHS